MLMDHLQSSSEKIDKLIDIYVGLWDAIRSMKQELVLLLTTFVSVFESYCDSGKFSDVVMTFDLMGQYGIELDVVVVNSLLSAMYRKSVLLFKKIEREKVFSKFETFSNAIDFLIQKKNFVSALLLWGMIYDDRIDRWIDSGF
ncbi:hypothetical protein QVD17_13687 [Tagetes erecta]|uniref:Pentatricopeptide repeat-containing protein n=1 Tax=Tagetes erecta TaxID=13708 RepID=A0AAD8KY39_TARER|nr:hypothetical protein QVD17_13687 [Tagetes erecta]